MTVTTINVNATIHTPDGTPLPDAEVVAILDRAEIDAGYVVPESQTFTTDINGQVVMPLWPNSLGVTESRYRIKVKHPTIANKTVLDVMATVPHEAGGNPITEVDLYTIAEQPAYEGKSEVVIATETAVQAAVDALAYRDRSQRWADEDEDVAIYVKPDRYSAKHWALKGQNYAFMAEQWANASQGVPTLSAGDLACPLLHLPLKNSLAMAMGVGSVTFTRSTTANYIDRYGVLQTAAIDAPRFEKEGLLIEGASTNLLTYSEQFDQSVWTKGNITVTPNDTAAPDGNTTADKTLETAVTGTHRYYYGAAAGAGTHTVSVYVKPINRQYFVMFLYNATDGLTGASKFDLFTGTVESGTGTIEALANGWFRCTATGTVTVLSGIYFELREIAAGNSYLAQVCAFSA